jgi:PqqD family protein of HPr-rel-A system
MIEPATQISLTAGISVQDLGADEGAVILHLESGQLFTCNDTTAEVLRAARENPTFAALLATLLETFDVDEAELRDDIGVIVQRLADEGILRLA